MLIGFIEKKKCSEPLYRRLETLLTDIPQAYGAHRGM